MKNVAYLRRVIRTLLDTIRSAPPRVCVDIRAWAEESRGGEVIGSIGAERDVLRDLPARVEALNQFKLEEELNLFERPVVRIANATVFGSEGFIRLPDDSFVAQTVWYREQLVFHQQFSNRDCARHSSVSGEFFPLVLYWSRSFYHWMIETLPLLHGIDEFLNAETCIIVPGPMANFQKESLRLCGIDLNRVREIFPDESLEVESLIFSPPATIGSARHFPVSGRIRNAFIRKAPTFLGPFNHNPDAVRWLSRVMFSRVDDSEFGKSTMPRRIYISRNNATGRRLNETEIIPVLEEFGIEIVQLESLSLSRQMRVFAEAELVVAPHGAGLSNLIFARRGTILLEIFERSVIRACFWTLCSTFGLKYKFLIGETMRTGTPDPDIRICPRSLRSTLGQIFDDL